MDDFSKSRLDRRPNPLRAAGHSRTVGTSADFAIGQTVADRYRIVSLLGRGGMGAVYQVEQIFMRKEFALKTLDVQGVTDLAWRRFQKEAEAVSRLDHAHVIKIHDFGLIDGKQPFYLMDLISGESLDTRIKRLGPLPVADALRIFTQISFALEHAHDKGVIHRDIKPSNIMLNYGAAVATADISKCSTVIVDFGISKLSESGTEAQNLTRTGEIFGSPLYMSPEQCLGTAVDKRTDIYSTGCSLFDALTGTPPHIGDSTLSTMMKHKEEKAPSLREASLGNEFSEGLEQLMARLLEKEPERRYQNFHDVARDLIQLQQGGRLAVGSAVPPIVAPATQHKSASNELLVIRLLLGLIAVLLVLLFVFWQNSKMAPVADKKTDTLTAPKAINAETEIAPEFKWYYETGALTKRNEEWRDAQYSEKFSTICRDPAGRMVRIFQFPNEFSVGAVRLSPQKLVQARGDVLIPCLAPIRFEPSFQCCDRPKIFERFRRDEVSSVVFDSVETASDVTLSYLNNWTELAEISCEKTTITDKGLAELTNVPKLTYLRVTYSLCDGAGIARIKSLNQLQRLHASAIGHPGKIIDALKGSTQIKVLRLWDTGMTDDDLKNVGLIKPLGELFVGINRKVTDRGVEYISALPNVEYLELQGCGITPNCVKSLKKMHGLKRIKISGETFNDDQVKEIKRELKLEDIFVDRHPVAD